MNEDVVGRGFDRAGVEWLEYETLTSEKGSGRIGKLWRRCAVRSCLEKERPRERLTVTSPLSTSEDDIKNADVPARNPYAVRTSTGQKPSPLTAESAHGCIDAQEAVVDAAPPEKRKTEPEMETEQGRSRVLGRRPRRYPDAEIVTQGTAGNATSRRSILLEVRCQYTINPLPRDSAVHSHGELERLIVRTNPSKHVTFDLHLIREPVSCSSDVDDNQGDEWDSRLPTLALIYTARIIRYCKPTG
ncbi:hypothetical protein KM043_014070 [Ampulex compressa]|nr:hypothetical protein KM043_014070 [Ampulex compressa]